MIDDLLLTKKQFRQSIEEQQKMQVVLNDQVELMRPRPIISQYPIVSKLNLYHRIKNIGNATAYSVVISIERSKGATTTYNIDFLSPGQEVNYFVGQAMTAGITDGKSVQYLMTEAKTKELEYYSLIKYTIEHTELINIPEVLFTKEPKLFVNYEMLEGVGKE